MGIDAAAKAREASLLRGAKYEMEAGIGSRTTPLVGWIPGTVKQLGNFMLRPFEMGGALLFGVHSDPGKITAPEVPEALKGSKLVEAFAKNWDHQKEIAAKRGEAFGSLLSFRIGDWWAKGSAADYAEAQVDNVIFPQERAGIIGTTAGIAIAKGATLLLKNNASTSAISLGELPSPPVPGIVDEVIRSIS